MGVVASKPFYSVVSGIKINLTAWQSEGSAEIFPPHPLNFFVRRQCDAKQHRTLVPNLKSETIGGTVLNGHSRPIMTVARGERPPAIHSLSASANGPARMGRSGQDASCFSAIPSQQQGGAVSSASGA
jgi:hypothetical protein